MNSFFSAYVGRLPLGLLLGCLAFSGCHGVKFGPAPMDASLPPSFKERILYPAGVAGYHIENLAGAIVTVPNAPGTGKPIQIGIIQPRGYTPTVTPITDTDSYYDSLVSNKAGANGSYLAFAAGMDAGDIAELTLTDVAEAQIPVTPAEWADVLKQMTDWVNGHPKLDQSTSRIWIQAVVLTKQTLTASTTIDSNATGQIGSVVGVNIIGGSVTVKRLASTAQKSVLIAFDGFDIDQMVDASKGHGGTPIQFPGLDPKSSEVILPASRFKPQMRILNDPIQMRVQQ